MKRRRVRKRFLKRRRISKHFADEVDRKLLRDSIESVRISESRVFTGRRNCEKTSFRKEYHKTTLTRRKRSLDGSTCDAIRVTRKRILIRQDFPHFPISLRRQLILPK